MYVAMGFFMLSWFALLGTYAMSPSFAQTRRKELGFGLDAVFIRDTSFAAEKKFQDVTDIAVNHVLGHVFVLQRSQPPVTVWGRDGNFLFEWKTVDIGFPHSITLFDTNPEDATVLITDMAGK